MVEGYIRGLTSNKAPATRQGSAAALRVLPLKLLMPRWREAIAALGQACQVCISVELYLVNHCLSASK